jgi:hypothetical protein
MSVSATRNAGRYVSCYEPEEEKYADAHSQEISKMARAWRAEFAHNPNRPDYATLEGILALRVDAAFPDISSRGFGDLKSSIVLSVLTSMRWE